MYWVENFEVSVSVAAEYHFFPPIKIIHRGLEIGGRKQIVARGIISFNQSLDPISELFVVETYNESL